MTDDLNPASMWRMNWLRNANNRSAQNKSLKTELHENAVPSPVRPAPPLPKYSAVRQNTAPPIRYDNSGDMVTAAMLGYWAASGSSSSSSDSSCDSSSDSGSSGGGD